VASGSSPALERDSDDTSGSGVDIGRLDEGAVLSLSIPISFMTNPYA